jgi:hypothetical protein
MQTTNKSPQRLVTIDPPIMRLIISFLSPIEAVKIAHTHVRLYVFSHVPLSHHSDAKRVVLRRQWQSRIARGLRQPALWSEWLVVAQSVADKSIDQVALREAQYMRIAEGRAEWQPPRPTLAAAPRNLAQRIRGFGGKDIDRLNTLYDVHKIPQDGDEAKNAVSNRSRFCSRSHVMFAKFWLQKCSGMIE